MPHDPHQTLRSLKRLLLIAADQERLDIALDDGTGAFVHGQTFQAHAVACAAALEVQKIIQEDNLLANVEAIGRYLSSFAAPIR